MILFTTNRHRHYRKSRATISSRPTRTFFLRNSKCGILLRLQIQCPQHFHEMAKRWCNAFPRSSPWYPTLESTTSVDQPPLGSKHLQISLPRSRTRYVCLPKMKSFTASHGSAHCCSGLIWGWITSAMTNLPWQQLSMRWFYPSYLSFLRSTQCVWGMYVSARWLPQSSKWHGERVYTLNSWR